tara:strand:- start:139 stop:288 length:150 start_codon:yes stop_codon:yes gene_type:complete
MFLPITLLFCGLGYLFYTSKKELAVVNESTSDNSKDDEEFNNDWEDLFI